MARPTTPIEVWAKDTLDLPVTGEPNKQRPIDDLWSKGYDRGQKPGCDEFNYVINMLSAWTKYLVNEGLPGYLPISGTSATLSGDVSGTINWSGNAAGSGNITVIDNSHNHISANITDATHLPTPNVLVKRDGGGSIVACDIVSRSSNASGDTPCFFLQNFGGQTLASLESTLTGPVYLRRFDPGNGSVLSSVTLNTDGSVVTTLPRSASNQEGQPSSLVRFDYLTQQINNLNTNLTNYINSRSTANYAVGWHKDEVTGFITQWGRFESGSNALEVRPFPISFPNVCLSITGNVGASVATVSALLIEPINNSSFRTKTVGSNLGCNWIAVGY